MGQKKSGTRDPVVIFSLIVILCCVLGLSRLLYSNIVPFHKVGDCLAEIPDKSAEKWEKPSDNVFLITEIGKKHYRTQWLKPDFMDNREYTMSFAFGNDNHAKTPCPGAE